MMKRPFSGIVCGLMLLVGSAYGQELTSPRNLSDLGPDAFSLDPALMPFTQAALRANSAQATATHSSANDDRIAALERRIADLENTQAVPDNPTVPAGFEDELSPSGGTIEQRLAQMDKALKDVRERLTSKAGSGAAFPLIKLGGFFQLDEGSYVQDANSVNTLGNLQNGVGFRRTRMQVYGNLTEFTHYIVEVDYALAGRPSFLDVWAEQTNLPVLGAVRIGNFRQPFSLDALTSVRQLQFLERSLPFQAFVPFRRVGAMAYRQSDDKMTNLFYSVYKTGGFDNNAFGDDRFATDLGNQGGVSFSTRMTHLLYYDEPANGRYLVHVGASYNFSQLTGSAINQPFYNAGAIPEFFVGFPNGVTSSSLVPLAIAGSAAAGTPRFVSTGAFQANSFNLVGGEFLVQRGPFHAQAEYMATSVNIPNGPPVFYDGAYAQAAWILTGENRIYNPVNGALDRLLPFTNFFSLGNRGVAGWGAWELAARWSYIDLNNPPGLNYLRSTTTGTPPTPVNPGTSGRLTDFTVGLNWYLNSNMRLVFNWINAQLHNQTKGFSNTQIFGTQLQAEF